MVQRTLAKEIRRARRKMAVSAERRRKRRRPAHHASMKLGAGWHERNFLTEVVIPTMFAKRNGSKLKPVFPEIADGQVCVTWIGHASFLIQTRHTSILIDPIWAKWLKVFKRIKHPGLELHDLPDIDLVLVTHAHFDHLDKKTLRAVAADQPIVVPEHVGNLVHGLGFNRVHELRRWDCLEHADVKVTLTPAHHWGARMLHDSHRGFGGFLLEFGGRSILHCGDSAYASGIFPQIADRANIEIALLPIGAYDAPTKRNVHMNPEEALTAFSELRAQKMIPMHYGSFRLSYEPPQEPPERLLESARKLGLLDKVHFLTEGQPVLF
jgi:L-ascorbate metabolism protein UlaG (beta-lactamase superfamily)